MAQELELLLKAKNLTDEAFKAVEGHVKSLDDAGRKASSGLVRAEKSLGKFGSSATRVGAGLSAGLTLPILGIGAATLKAAADAQEGENLVAESFGNMTGAAQEWSKKVSDAVGANAYKLRENAASMYLLAKNMGAGTDEAFQMSTKLTQLAGDLDSFLNLSAKGIDPVRALQSGLVGNTEALRSLNVFVNQATLEQIAYEKGIAETGSKLTQTQKFLATYAAIMDQTSKAQGDLARTMDSPTNQMRIMREQLTQLSIEFGTALLPVAQDVLTMLRDDFLPVLKAGVEWFTNLDPATQKWVVGLGGLAAALGPALVVVGQLAAGLGVLLPLFTAAGPAIGGATAALGPFAAIVAAIAGGAALGIWLRDNTEWFRGMTNAIGDTLGNLIEFFRQSEKGTDVTENWTAAQKESAAAFYQMRIEMAKTAGASEDVIRGFQEMYDKVVGHSYVPDMLEGIRYHFGTLEDVMLAPVRDVVGAIESQFQELGDWVGGFWGSLLGSLGGVFSGFVGNIASDLAGKLGGWIGGLFHDEEEEVNDIRDKFFSQFEDGFIGLQRLLAGTIGAAENEDYVKRIFDAETVGEFEDAIRLVQDLLADLGKPINIPVNVGYSGGLPPGYPTVPGAARGAVVLPIRPRQAAAGDLVSARAGGTLYNVGEGGDAEVIAPVKALFGQLGDQIASKVAAAVSAGSGRPIVVQSILDGRQVSTALVQRNRLGLFPIAAGSVRNG